MKSRALFFEAPRSVAIRDVELPAARDGEVLVRGLASAISQGTEMLLYRGEGPEPFDPSLPNAEGTTAAPTYPRRYGYAWVGEIREDGAAGGQRVFALAPHGDAHVLLLSAAARLIRSDIPAARATLAANLETAITCAWDADPSFGERVVVFGGGVVGLLTAWILRRSGCRVTLIDPRRVRRECASSVLGVSSALASPDDASATNADVVIEATGDPAVLNAAIACCAPSARVVVASFYGRRRAAIDLGDKFHRQRLSLIASQVSTIPSHLTPRWNADRRFGIVQDLLESPELDALIAPPIPFEQAPALYAQLGREEEEEDASSLPCHVLTYR